MHEAANNYIKKVRREYYRHFRNSVVLDVGSLDINGSNRVHFITPKFYFGVDIGKGKNVDLVCPIHLTNLKIKFTVVMCTEMLEHDKYFDLSMEKMIEYLHPFGLLLITAAGPERAEHGTHKHAPKSSPFTLDYYKPVTIEMLQKHLVNCHYSDIEYSADKTDIYAHAIK